MGRLLFHECLGRGGFGEVYRCTWVREGGMELQTAVKVLNASVARGSDAQRRLKDEARLLGAITHPSILRVYDLVEIRGNVAMIAEYVDGCDLDRAILDGLPPRAVLGVVGRISEALAAAWGDISAITGRPLRLVHRDCKPENFRITPGGEVKVLDFGVARAAELRREAQTATNTVLGSYRYMAPERFDADYEAHPSGDVFSLGCILYEGMTARRLFEHLSMREMLVLSIPGSDRFESYIHERLAELPPEIDPGISQLIERLVDRDPAKRPTPGRLATLCDDLIDLMDGPDLRAWCRARVWHPQTVGPGEWTAMQFHLEPSASGGFALPELPGTDVGEFPTDGPGTSDATLPDLEVVRRGPTTDAPTFGPRDLGASTGASDAVAGGWNPDDDATQRVDLAEIARRAKLGDDPTLLRPPGDPPPAALAPAPDADSDPDATLIRPVPREEPADRAPDPSPVPADRAPDPSATSDDADDTTDPREAAREPHPARPPAGPEVHRAEHEARMAAWSAKPEPTPTRPTPASHHGAIVANLAVITLLGGVGAITLLIWLLVF